MTYNFDPDRWYDDELAFLDRERHSGRLSAKEYGRRVADLDRRLAEMWRRLDGSYQIPDFTPSG